jgi:hypothetical protein
MSKESDQLMEAYLKAAKHHAAWSESVNDLLARIERGARKAGIKDFDLRFPITFSGGDYHDEYVCVRFDDDGAIFIDSCDNEEAAGELPIDVVYAFCEQFMNTACKFLHKHE